MKDVESWTLWIRKGRCGEKQRSQSLGLGWKELLGGEEAGPGAGLVFGPAPGARAAAPGPSAQFLSLAASCSSRQLQN